MVQLTIHLEERGKELSLPAVVVALLGEQLLPTPEIRGSNPEIAKIFSCIRLLHEVETTEMKKKRSGKARF